MALDGETRAGRLAEGREPVGIGADNGGAGKFADQGAKPVLEIGEHQVGDEIACPRSPRQMAGDQGSVENGGRLAHDGLAA